MKLTNTTIKFTVVLPSVEFNTEQYTLDQLRDALTSAAEQAVYDKCQDETWIDCPSYPAINIPPLVWHQKNSNRDS